MNLQHRINAQAIIEIIKQLKANRAATYNHIKELKQDGYLTEDMELTDIGRIVLM